MKIKGRRGFIIIVCLLVLLVPAGVFAASTTKTLSTNFTLVNLGTTSADVQIAYYKEDGSVWSATNTSLTLDPDGGQAIVAQYNDPTMSTGKGSAVISSSQQLGAVVQVLARGQQIPTFGAYSGFLAGSGKVYVPLVMRRVAGGTANTQIMIQNTAAQGDATVSVNFFAATGSPAPTSFTKSNIVIKPGTSYYYDVELESNLGDGWFGSAEVNAGAGQVAVVVNTFSGANGLQTFNGFPADSVGTKWAVPLFASRLGSGNLNTPVAIQNLSGNTIGIGAISLDCIGAPGTGSNNFTKTNATTITNNSAYYFNPVTDQTIPGNWYGSCTVDAGAANIIVYVQMRKPNVTDETAAFEAFKTSSTDTIVFVPLAGKRLPTASTAITFQNLGTQDAKVKLTYTRSPNCAVGNTTYVYNDIIPANGGQLIQNLRLPNTRPDMPDGWFGTLKVEDDPNEATPAQPIVGFVQITNITGAAGDTLMVYNAFSKP